MGTDDREQSTCGGALQCDRKGSASRTRQEEVRRTCAPPYASCVECTTHRVTVHATIDELQLLNNSIAPPPSW